MGLMDKLKVQADQLAAKAQQGTAQMQTKLDAVQARRGSDLLLRDLGAAYYSEQRQHGSHDAVEQALAALDSHANQAGPVDASTPEPQPMPTQAAAVPTGDQPSGDFNLDDV